MRMESPTESEISIEDQLRIDSCCDDFEKRLGTSKEISIADCLSRFSDAPGLTDSLLYEVVRVALEYGRLDLPRAYLTSEDQGHVGVVARACRHFGNPELSTDPYPTTQNILVNHFPKTERFECIGLIGSGSMGDVYEAFDCERNMKVALKILHCLNSETLHQFKQEFRSLAELEHENLISLYELFQSDQHWYFSMEFIEGIDILSYCREQNCADISIIRSCFEQLAYGLDYLHQSGKIHRDLKPSNLRVTPQGKLKILDFGLVLEFTKLSLPQRLAGTPAYMSPEQMTSQSLSPSSDWFSTGIILYELLTGNRPGTEQLSSQDVKSLPNDLRKLRVGLTLQDPRKRPSKEEIFDLLGLNNALLPTKPSEIFIERQELLQRLNAHTPQSDTNKSSLVVLSGRSGEGKSSLAQSYLSKIGNSPDTIILSSRCYDHETVQYPGIDGLVDELSRYLVSLPQSFLAKLAPKNLPFLIHIFPSLAKVVWPEQQGASPVEDDLPPRLFRQKGARSLSQLLKNLANHSRLTLFIDDFHWAGEDSKTLLTLFSREIPSSLVLLTCRSEHSQFKPLLESVNSLAERASNLRFEHLKVSPLTRTETSELASQICHKQGCHAFTHDQLIQIHNESGGHAYLVNELLWNNWDKKERSVRLDSLASILQARIAALSVKKRTLLEVVALSAIPLRTEWCYQLSNLHEFDPLLVRQLKDEKLISYSEFGMNALVQPYHDAIRNAVVESLSDSKRVTCHQQLALHFQKQSEAIAPQTIAFHLEQAGDSNQAAGYFQRAGYQALETFAFEQAATYFRKALATHRSLPQLDVLEIRQRLAEALENAGRSYDAAEELRQLSTQVEENERAGLLRHAALLYCSSGHLNQGLDLLRDLLRNIGYGVHHGRRVRNGLSWIILQLTLTWKLRRIPKKQQIDSALAKKADLFSAAASGLSLVDPFVAAHLRAKGTHFALRCGDADRLGKALAFNASYQSSGSHLLWKHVEQTDSLVRELCENANTPQARGIYLMARGVIIGHRGHLIEAIDVLKQSEQILVKECRGVWWELAIVRTSLMWNLSLSGDLLELNMFIQGFLEETRQRNDLFMSANMHTYPIPLILLSQNKPKEAAKIADKAITEWSQNPGFHIQHYTHMVGRAMIYLYEGDGKKASRFFEDKWNGFMNSGMFLFPYIRMWSLDARITVGIGAANAAKGTSEKYLKLIRTWIKSLRKTPLEIAPVLALRFEGVLAHLQGNSDIAEKLLSQASSKLRRHNLNTYALSTEHFLAGTKGTQCTHKTQEEFASRGIQSPKRWRRTQLGI